MANAEQVKGIKYLSKSSVRRARMAEKRRAARLRRRAEKRDPENAPIRCIAGWAD